MDRLVFNCEISSGMGMYSELAFPTHAQIQGLPKDWSDNMFRGSLNAAVIDYPVELSALGEGFRVQKLDNKKFTPAVVIPQTAIGNNSLGPRGNDTERGTGQAWRAQINVTKTGEKADVWAVRRIGSAYNDIIELMSDMKLRDHLRLKDGDKIELTLFAGDVRPAATPHPPANDVRPGWRKVLGL
ncbi:MAG: DUF120 domain-containing protein [Alphaproteobacteria bacterium]